MAALIATAMKATTIKVETMQPITFSLLNQMELFHPMVWNILQNPCVRWNHNAMNQTI